MGDKEKVRWALPVVGCVLYLTGGAVGPKMAPGWTEARAYLHAEPSYDFIFQGGVPHGIGNTGGLLIG